MKVYMIYKRSLYNNLSLFKKIIYLLKGGSRSDTLDGFTLNSATANVYANINSDKILYLKECDMDEVSYNIFFINNHKKKITCYRLDDRDEKIIIKIGDKTKLIKKGVIFYDSP